MSVLIAAPGLVANDETVRHEYAVNWKELDIAFEAYLASPGAETAGALTKLLPPGVADRHAEVFGPDGRETVGRIYRQLARLDPLVKSGQAHALDVAFALIAVSDGHFTEELLALIPESIELHPAAFLAALRRNRTRPFATCERATNFGLEYVDDPAGEIRALRERIRSVERVADPELAEEKACVLARLHDVADRMSR